MLPLARLHMSPSGPLQLERFRLYPAFDHKGNDMTPFLVQSNFLCFTKKTKAKLPKNCQSETISLYSRIFIYKYPSIVNA
jgi:hypothetical protein